MYKFELSMLNDPAVVGLSANDRINELSNIKYYIREQLDVLGIDTLITASDSPSTCVYPESTHRYFVIDPKGYLRYDQPYYCVDMKKIKAVNAEEARDRATAQHMFDIIAIARQHAAGFRANAA